MCCGSGCNGCPFMSMQEPVKEVKMIEVSKDDYEMLVMAAAETLLVDVMDHQSMLDMAMAGEVPGVENITQEDVVAADQEVADIIEMISKGSLSELVETLRRKGY